MSQKPPKKDLLTSRRTLLKSAGLGGAALLVGCGNNDDASSAGDQDVARTARTLKMVTTWPKNFPGVGTGAERMAERVDELSERGQ